MRWHIMISLVGQNLSIQGRTLDHYRILEILTATTSIIVGLDHRCISLETMARATSRSRASIGGY